jgi:hypothetical protein
MQSGKKIDVDELKSRIVEGVKKGVSGKFTNQDVSHSMMSMGGVMKENSSKRMNRSSRSKSPGHSLIGGGNGTSFDEVPERGSAVKFDQSNNSIGGGEPAWYRALKKNVK